MRSPTAAFDWARAHGISIVKPPICQEYEFPKDWQEHSGELVPRAPLDNALGGTSDETIEWIKKLPIGPERAKLIERAIELSEARKPELFALANELSPESQGRVCAIRVRGMRLNAEECQKFVESLPPGVMREAAWREIGKSYLYFGFANLPEAGPDHDALLAGMSVASNSVIGFGTPLFQLIADPMRRREVFDDLALRLDQSSEMTGGDAFENLMNSPDVPAEWKKPWRQR
jgi:hypothetical protein